MMELTSTLLLVSAVYFLLISGVYLTLLFLSWRKIKRYNQVTHPIASELPVSFIIPAFNEEELIVETIQTYLNLPQTKKEIIVIDDGSHDQTMRLLKTMFQLRKIDGKENFYHSLFYPELRVIEAPHMGKAQALNFGVTHARFDLICTLDADSVPEAKGVEACLTAFANDPDLKAVGGIIQILNSSVLKDNSPVEHKSRDWLPSFQRVEYLRTFVCERLGWSYLGSTLLISGAFCMIRKEAVRKIGGFNNRSITEDFDLIVRLRRAYQGTRAKFKILPVTTCYTQAPTSLRHLRLQRLRWQMGLVQTLADNLGLFFHPGHGPMGLLAVPYFWIVEVLSPVMEGLAMIAIGSALYFNILQIQDVAFYFGLGILFNLALTLFGIYLDERYVSERNHWSLMKTSFHVVLVHLGYKQLNSWWRLLALFRTFTHPHTWGEKPRKEIIHLKT